MEGHLERRVKHRRILLKSLIQVHVHSIRLVLSTGISICIYWCFALYDVWNRKILWRNSTHLLFCPWTSRTGTTNILTSCPAHLSLQVFLSARTRPTLPTSHTNSRWTSVTQKFFKCELIHIKMLSRHRLTRPILFTLIQLIWFFHSSERVLLFWNKGEMSRELKPWSAFIWLAECWSCDCMQRSNRFIEIAKVSFPVFLLC